MTLQSLYGGQFYIISSVDKTKSSSFSSVGMRAPPAKWVFIFTKVQAMDAFASVISRPWRRPFFQILRSSAKLLGVCDLLRRLFLIIVIITNLFYYYYHHCPYYNYYSPHYYY